METTKTGTAVSVETANMNLMAYLIARIDASEYMGEEKAEKLSPTEKVRFFFGTFRKEYGRIPTPDSIEEYLMGLPACISIAYSNSEIKERMESLGYGVPEEEDVTLWWKQCARGLLRLKQLADSAADPWFPADILGRLYGQEGPEGKEDAR